MKVSAPITRIETTSGQPVTSVSGIAVAKSRTESASRRVIMKVAELSRRVSGPKRASSSS